MKQELSLMAAAVMLGGALLLSTGCAKESSVNEKYRPAGAEISFSASTGYENGSGTRTEYSGVLSGTSPQYERIDWVSGDKVAIAYVHGSISKASDYVVTTIDETSGRNSVASVAAVSDQQKLTWDSGDGDHVFYAMYPANGFEDNTSADLTTAGHVSATIPATQTFHENGGKYLPPMEYGYMFSYKKIEGDSHESRVTLPFTPAVTTFEFQLQRGAGEPNASVTGVRLSASTALTGTFEFDITGGDANGATWGTVSTSDPGNTITVNFASAVTLPAHGAETYLDFTLFALPVEQTGLTLKLLYSNGTSKSLSLTGGTFAAGKKHIITNTSVPGGNWEYNIGTLTPITVTYGGSSAATLASGFTSYRTDGTTPQAVPFILEYSATGADGTWSTSKPAWLTPSGNFNGSTTGQTLTMNVAAQSATSSSPHRENMLENGNGTLGDYYDLSRRNWGTGGTTTNSPGWTANCYIVDRPGTYKFPLVYGNAFNNGSLNQDAFRGNWRGSGYWFRYGYIHNSSEMYLGSFRDHRDDQYGNVYLITSNLHDNTSVSPNDVYLTKFGTPTADVVWSDVTNLVTSVAVSGNYCTFTVSPDYIDQGNALIAVRLNGTIIWSWHIWVTDQMDSSDAFAPVNLGYCDGVKSTYYAPRTYYVRARQDITGGQTSNVVYVQETTYSVNTSGTAYNTYYQWGRKDPFLPGRYATDNSLNSASPGTSIQNPTTYYNLAISWCAAYDYIVDCNPDNLRNEGWKYPLNLWNSRTANCKSDGDYNTSDWEVKKTVYDPCPSGYKVPNIEIFDSSVNSPSLGVLTDTSSGVCFYSATAYDYQGACYWNGSSMQTSFRKAALPVRPYRE